MKLCVFKYPFSIGLVQCVCCLGEECVMLGFSYLFFIYPLNMVLCLLWWTVYYWHMSPLSPLSSSVFLLSWSFHQCFIFIFIHLPLVIDIHYIKLTHTKSLILVLNSKNIMERSVNPLCVKLILSKGALVIAVISRINIRGLEL